MQRTLVSILVLIAACVVMSAEHAQSATATAAADNPIVDEIYVVFKTSGGSFAGTENEVLTVYNNGSVTISKRNTFAGNTDIDMQLGFVGASGAQTLINDLVAAGASSLSDQDTVVSDIPLKTLTISNGNTMAVARNFSYFTSTANDYSVVNQVLSDFITANFPGF